MGKRIGTFIKTAREAQGYSQADISRVLGLKTAQSVSNIERGVSPVPAKKIRKLARMLRVEPLTIVDTVIAEKRNRYMRAAGIRG
jgi:transcriptional regulator with XRE-family HTH domain